MKVVFLMKKLLPNMRYDRIGLAGLALMSAVVWGQLSPWPLSKWQVYLIQNGQVVGGPLPERALVYPGDSFMAVVDTTGMGASGITGWLWRLDPTWGGGGFGYATSTNDTFLFQTGSRRAHPEPPPFLLSLVTTGGSDSATSYRILQLRRTWGTTARSRFWACPGGQAEVVFDFMTTDVDSIRAWVEVGGMPYASVVARQPMRWRFTAPSTPGSYPILGEVYIRGGHTIPLDHLYPISLEVGNLSFRDCQIATWGSYCAGQPVELKLDWYEDAPLPSSVSWDFDGDGQIDGQGLIGRYVYGAPGTYTASAFLQWSGGCRDTLQTQVVIESGSPLAMPSVGGVPSYAVGDVVSLRVSAVRGTVYVDMNNDGTWEGIAGPGSTGSLRTPPYRFTAPPPAGGYPIRIRQELCGQSREDIVLWNPTINPSPLPDGTIQVLHGVFCAGDSVTVRIVPGANFQPGQPGYTVSWNFGSGWTDPSPTAVETTIVWSGQPLNIQAWLYHPQGGSRSLPAVPVQAPPPTGWGATSTTVVRRYVANCSHDLCLNTESLVWCGGDIVEILPRMKPYTSDWQWRLLLPTDTITFPAGGIPERYLYRLPTAPGVYSIESQVITRCGVWRSIISIRVESQGTGRPGHLQPIRTPCGMGGSDFLFGPEQTLTVCAGESFPVYWIDAMEYGGDGLSHLDVVYADGRRAEVIDGSAIRAPLQAGSYTLYLLWRSCGGRVDTVPLYLEVREARAASFTAPTRACVGQPITVQRDGPLTLSGNPVGLRWLFGDGTERGDTARLLTYTYQSPGTYTITLAAWDAACGRTSFSRSIRVAAGLPQVQILSAVVQNGVLTYQGSVTDADSIVWDFGDGTVAVGVLSGTHIYTGSGPYRVRLYAFNGCGSQMAEMQVTTLPRVEAGLWRVYPNPATQTLWVEVPEGEGGRIALYTLLGQRLRQWDVKEGLQGLSVGDLPRGLYVVRVEGRDVIHGLRLMLE